MNTERDRFLAKQMGECQHSFGPLNNHGKCKCGHPQFLEPYQTNFSTWEGFGKLWEFSQKQDWWEEFTEDNYNRMFAKDWSHNVLPKIIHPDRLADAVYEYLNGKD